MEATPEGRPPDAGLDRHVEEAYASLRRLARRAVRGRTGARVLEPTELVHELYMKLARTHRTNLGRSELLALAGSVLRSVLVDHARELATLKRSGTHLSLDANTPAEREEVDVLGLHEALEKLARLDPRMARVVELRVFAGLEIEEIAGTLGVSSRTVVKDWALAKAWLHREMKP